MTGFRSPFSVATFVVAYLAIVPACAAFEFLALARHPQVTGILERTGVQVRLFRAANGAMTPTIQTGDMLVGDLRDAGRQPRRGDIIAYRGAGELIFIRRVVGLAGDRVAFEGRRLFLDGGATTPDMVPDTAAGWMAVETIPGSASTTHTVQCGAAELPLTGSTPESVVPPGTVFVAGDNRCLAEDSRHVGPVPLEAILARVVVRLEPRTTWFVEPDTLARP